MRGLTAWRRRHCLPRITVATLCLIGAASCAAGPPPGSVAARLHTADGWTIRGDVYRPPGHRRGAVLLLHQRGGRAADWESLCQALKAAGYTALAIDQRGTGRSTRGPGPTGDNAPWDTGGDIQACAAYLKGDGPLALIGASYGANNALIYAASHPEQVRALVLLSPGDDYHGLEALGPARRYPEPVDTYTGRADPIDGTGPQDIQRVLPGRVHPLHALAGSGHGTALLSGQVNSQIVKFLRANLR